MASSAETDHPATAILTFLIVDMRGYTSFTAAHGDEAAARLATRFAEIAETVVGEREGRVVELRGDEALAVFPSARAALRAAVALQSRLAEEEGREGSIPLGVGIGLDAGEAIPVRGGYRGGALNLAARLCSLAGPGEVLASEELVHLARKVEDLDYVSRGRVSLKGLAEPVGVFQVARTGTLAQTPPPIQAPDAGSRNNLPAEPTQFIGRRQETEAVVSMLFRPAVRLLTLSGTGGTGKTRLALHAASMVLDHFKDGVFFVSLASVMDAEIVMPSVANALGIVEESGTSPERSLLNELRTKHCLLLLDNFEHLREAAPYVSNLLAGCPRLKVLVTSRAVLNEYGEYNLEVPPLAIPGPDADGDLASLLSLDSVSLFCERARATQAAFELTGENARPVAEICRRLDGLPLALELAAARTRVLPPRALLGRLEKRFQILTGGARGMPERQQTLRGTIDWSHGLLRPAEQTLFARLAVFAGGGSLEAIEAICAGPESADIDVLDGVTALVENSLLRQVGDEEPRFVMLETVREYALDRLLANQSADQVRECHAEYFLALAEEANRGIRGPEQAAWLDRLDIEHDNMRAALAWALAGGRAELGLKLASSLWRYWWGRGHLSEGRRWLESLLDADQSTPEVRGAALNGLANLVWSQGDLDRAETLHNEALALRRRVGDKQAIALSLNNLGIVAERRGDFEAAEGRYREALDVAREVDDAWALALLLGNLSGVLGSKGQRAEAARLGEESLALWRDLGDRLNESRVLNSLASLALEDGDQQRAARLQRQSLILCSRLGNQENMAFCLEGAAKILAFASSGVEAALLWGAADAVRYALEQGFPPAEQIERNRYVERVRTQMGAEAFAAAWAQGETLTSESAQARAVEALQRIEEAGPAGPGRLP